MATSIPLWRGFNLVDLFSTSVRWKEHFPMDDGLIAEADFAMIRELGFNFVRIPMSYLFFGKGPFGRTPDEKRLYLIDRVVEFGRSHNIHVALAFHRAPGYCITASTPFDFPEKGNLFSDEEEQRDFVTWWRMLAERYRHIPSNALSFNLLNEPMQPNDIPDQQFEKVFRPAIEAIAAVNPDRLIHVEGPVRRIDGLPTMVPAPASIATLPNVINSVHFYTPLGLTHWRCPWTDDFLGSSPGSSPPTWPYRGADGTADGGGVWDREALRAQLKPFLDLAQAGHAVHVGEMGAYSALPHDVYIAYCKDLMSILAEDRIGYALWNFRGPFGILDTRRTDVDYVDFQGHRLDQKLVDVLRGKFRDHNL